MSTDKLYKHGVKVGYEHALFIKTHTHTHTHTHTYTHTHTLY